MFKHHGDESRLAVIELGRVGHTTLEIATRTGVSAPTVWRWLTQAGLCRRRRGQHGTKYDHIVVAPLERDLAWIACFLDCEGSLGLAIRNSARSFLPSMFIANTDQAMIDRGVLLLEAAGQKVGVWHGTNKGLGRKKIHQIFAHNYGVARLLVRLHPHLIIKRQFAEALIGLFCDRTIGDFWTEDEKALAHFIRYEFMPRSRKGKKTPPARPASYDRLIAKARALASRPEEVETSPSKTS